MIYCDLLGWPPQAQNVHILKDLTSGALDQLERPVTTNYARSEMLHKELVKLRLVNLLFAGNLGIKTWWERMQEFWLK